MGSTQLQLYDVICLFVMFLFGCSYVIGTINVPTLQELTTRAPFLAVHCTKLPWPAGLGSGRFSPDGQVPAL